jgi:thiol-disulfide isomerase/thioredoxin
MHRLRLPAATQGLALALGLAGGLVVPATATATAADRPAEEILAEIDAVDIPRLDPAKRGDTQAMTEYVLRRRAATARKGELILELFHAHPDHPRLVPLFSDRWQNILLVESDQAASPKFVAELDEVMARAKADRLKADAAFFKAILQIRNGEVGPDEILKTVERFLELAPKDPRGAMLLNSVAGELEGTPRQAELLRRIAAGFPDSPHAESARATLKKLESVGKPFALEFVDAIRGTPVSIEKLRGKVVVVDFWATWCGPCVEEMPVMKSLYSRYHGHDVEFIGVSLDEPKEDGGLEKLKDFVARHGITWPQYYQGQGGRSPFSRGWGVDAIPTVFVVDRDGNLASVDARGRLDEIIPELLRKDRAGK